MDLGALLEKNRQSFINGPNLNLLGVREPDIYGHSNFEDYLAQLRGQYSDVDIEYFQSNHEGAIIDKLHEKGFSGCDAIILNAGAYTHTSLAIADAIAAINTPVIEVHISNVHAREEIRIRRAEDGPNSFSPHSGRCRKGPV